MKNISKVCITCFTCCLLFSTLIIGKNRGNGKVHPYSMQLKALSGPNSTSVYVSVGSMDIKNFSVPSHLKKMSIKIRNKSGAVVYNKNYFNVELNSGKAEVSIGESLVHNLLEVTAHIKNKQTRNEKILTGNTFVLLRPDLVINKIVHPDTVNTNEPFNIESYIVERNKDAGAVTNVSLYRGDSLLRKITGISISPGGNVSAVFQNLVNTDTGHVTYRILISGTSPAEYDTTNNTKNVNIYFIDPVQLHSMRFNANYYLTKNIIEVSKDVTPCGTNADTTLGESSGFQCYYSLSNVNINTANNNFPITAIDIAINNENGEFVNLNSSNISYSSNYGYYYGTFNDAGSGVALNYSYNSSTKNLSFVLYQYLSNVVYISSQNGTVSITKNQNKILDSEKYLNIDLEVKIAGEFYGGRIAFNDLPQLQHTQFSFSYNYFDWNCNSTAEHTEYDSYDTFNASIYGVTDTIYFGKKAENNFALKVPGSTELEQNYPNPFNPVTTIKYRLSGKMHVDLTVYDILGNKVAILVNGVQNAGEHNVNFNADNLASGVYIYRLQTPNFTTTKKFIQQK